MSYDAGYERCAHLYDLFATGEKTEFFLHYGVEAGEILDIGAGTGRIAISLAEKGVKVWCVEPSPAMREQLERKLGNRPKLAEKIHLTAGDASSFNLHRTFPAAILSGSFDHFLNDQNRLSSLRNIAKHLQLGATLVFDVGIGYMNDSPLEPGGQAKLGNKEYRRFFSRKRMPDETLDWFLIYEVHQSGKLIERIEQHSSSGIIDRSGIHGLLKQAGFGIRREFGNYDFKAFEEGDKMLVTEAVKEG